MFSRFFSIFLNHTPSQDVTNMWILVGLGNPGKEYQDNRHNIGFMVIDEIAREYGFPAFRAKFQSELCGKRTDCDAQFNEMFVARLIERYVLADWRAINLHCKAYPMECNSFSALEGWSRESHNKNVARIANQRSEEIARQREAAILDEERQQAASLVSAARAALATYLRMRYPAAVAPDVINR